jgi:hypothetical protein
LVRTTGSRLVASVTSPTCLMRSPVVNGSMKRNPIEISRISRFSAFARKGCSSRVCHRDAGDRMAVVPRFLCPSSTDVSDCVITSETSNQESNRRASV